MKKFYLLCLLALIVVSQAFSSFRFNAVQSVLNDLKTYIGSFRYGPTDDFDGDGVINQDDIDDDNDGVPDAVESPACFYTATDWNTGAKPASGLTISSGLSTTNGNFNQLLDGVSNVNAVTFTSAQSIQNANVYLFTFVHPVRIDALYLQFNTTSQFANTTKIQGSNTNNGSDWMDLSAAIIQTPAINTTVNGFVSVSSSIKYPVTLNTTTAYKYIRITGVAASNVAAQNASEVYFDFNLAAYVASSYPKATCVDANIDGDAAPPHMDLDSDGDGCSDAYESGATTDKTTNYSFPYIDTNGDGLVNAVDPDGNGIVNYTSTYGFYALASYFKACADTDGDGVLDINDLDDDNDGIPDKVECPDLFVNMGANGGFSGTADALPNWYVGVTTTALPITESFTPTVIPVPYNRDVYNYGVGSGTQVNSPLTGGLFDLYESGNPATGLQFVLQEGDPQHPIVNKLANPLIAGATYNFSFDLGNRASGSANKYIVLLYNADTKMPEKILLSGVLNTLPAYNSIPSYVNFTGSFIPSSSANYYLLFYPSISGGAADDFVIDRVAVGAATISVCDQDGDGIPNFLDLDSDGDGCSDLIEAGVSPSTDVFTPGATNNFGGSYGISNPSGSQLNPNGTDANNNGLNDSVENGLSGNVNYISYYNFYALTASINLCSDFDNDGKADFIDIDDDNDGVPDAIESPGCFYTQAEAVKITSVTSALTQYSTNVIANSYDNNVVTESAFLPNQDWIGKTIFNISIPAPIAISSVNFDIGDWYLSTGTGSTFKLQGGDGQIWEDLSVAMSNTTTADFSINNTLHVGKAYSRYRIVGVAGTSYYSGVNEITLTPYQYNASQHPKASCTGSDINGNGKPNHQDLDSDGDGCSDAYEAGATSVKTANYKFAASPDANNNGLNDTVENGATGTINYTYLLYAYDASLSLCVDTDGDGILDLVDIDDDNDGIPDIMEESCIVNVASKTGIVVSKPSTINYNFDGTQTLANLVDGVDANDYIIYSPSGTLNNAEWFRVEFTTPKVLTQWEIGQYSGQTLFATTSTYKVQGSNDGISWTDVTATLTYSNTGSGQSSQANSNIATFEQNNNAYKYYRYFGITGTSGGGWATEFFFREKNCTELDTDGDGIPNRLDLDSDGDGCSDSYEAGATTDLSPNFAFTSAVGANGLADVKETGVDSGTINYISTYTQYAIASNLALCADSDGDGISDIIDIDDDNDGILDAVESPACFYTGTEANTILGITSPLNGSTGKPLANTEIATMHNGSVSDATPYSFAASQTAAVGAPVFTIQYPTAIVLSSVTVTQAASGITATGFGKLYGSNDGISYTLLTSGTNGIALNTASVIFANTNTAAYKYYQIRSIGTVLAGNATAITIGTGSIQEITSVMAVSPAYNPSAHPKPNCSNDIDGDGIPNHLDLDSDGDGCSDALEAGATTDTTPNYVFTGAVGANGLIDTKETSAESGVVNYTSTYHQFAIAKNLASCVDTDGDGLNDIVDIDDDNDGIPDAIESPGCFFSYGEISVPASVTSTVANTGTISNLYDTNRATSFNFTASAAITGLTLLELTPQFPLEATALQLEMNTSAQTAFNASSLTIEGWNGTSWVTLMPAFNPLAAPNLVSFNFHTFTFSQNQNAKYSKFRIQGVSGTVTANLIREVRLIPAALYVPSAYPKPNCLDDNDGDGIPNHQDLDSDGDGCFDKLEAKVPGATLNGSYTDGLTVPANTTGNVGVNGLANTLETVADNGILNYNPAYQNAINVKLAACTDTDGDGIPDLIDIDDDNDGVLDTNEGYSTNEVAIKPTSNAFAFTSCAAPAGVLNNTVTFTTNGGTLGNATVADGFNYTEKGTNIEVGDKYTLTFATPVILSKLMVNSVFSPIGEFTVTYNDNTVATKLPIAIVPGASPSDYGYVNVSGKLYSYNDAVYGPYIADLNWGGSSNGQAGGILSFPTLDVSKKVKSITFTIVGIPVGGTTPLAALVSPIIREDCYLDTDNDGIPNHLDLDSDGDECTDAVEAATSGQTGVTMLTGTVKNGSGGAVTSTKNNPNAVVAGPYGSNGFADVLQNPSNADAYNYTYTYSKALDNTIKDCCPVIANNTIAGDQSTCNNITPELLTGSTPTVDPTGATVLYKWMSSTTSATTGFSDITSGGTSKDYSFSGPLNQTTYFKRMAYSSGCPEESSNVITITVTPGAIAGILSGNDNICVNGTTAFSSTISGGTWTSNHPEVASIVASTGVITGLAPGTAIMTYTVAGSGGCGNAIATRLVTVNAAPVTGTLSGTQNICVLASTTFSSTISGGNWATDNPGVATVGASTGLVNGVSAGTATISYTVTGAGDCPDVIATRLVTVALAPVAGTLSGNQNICVGGASTFTSTSTGGTWSSNASSIASIDPLTGAISGLAAGTATMTYTVAGSGGCGNAIVTRDVTVTAAAVAGTLSGVQNICAGGTSTFSSTINGGSWSSGDLEVATIDPTTGLINGLTAGTATMTYTVTGTGGCGDATVSRSVTVTAAPVAGTLSGNQNICVDATTTFSSTTGGGSWSSGNPGVATINASTGEILGLTAGTATMTYTVAGSGGCADVTDTRVVTVTAAAVAGTLSGIQGICAGGTTTFSSTITGGSWSSGNTAVATIDPTTGVINGLTAGTSTMTYTVAGAGGCGNATVTRIVTVTAAAVAGTLNGIQNICVGGSTTFSSTISGGNWSSGNTSIATIDPSTGLITGLTAGTVTMTYTVTGTGGCADAVATRTLTLSAAPDAGTLSGSQNICVGGTGTFTSTTTGGTWSSNATAIATVDPSTGAIHGLAAGTATITYTVAGSGGCDNATVTRDITVTAAAVAGTLSGVQNICAGGTSTFSSTINGGSWSSGNLAVATIDPTTGLINGLTAGTATITYTVTGTGGCGNATVTRTVTVTAAPVAGTLSGNQNICVDAATTFSSTTSGGSWSSGNPGVATINASTGEIHSLAAGTATMTYTVAGSGGCADVTATRVVTVTAAAVAGTLSGIQSICAGGTSTFSSTITGGSWSSGNTAVATIDPTTGVINGLTAGTSTMTYTVAGAGGCGNATVTRMVTVTAAAVAGTLNGIQNICVGGSTTFSSTISGGNWSSGNTSIATIDLSTGLITGLTAGTVTMTYTVTGTGGCADAVATRTLTLSAAPDAGTLSGSQNICVGGVVTFTSTTTGGTWSSNATAIATVDPSTGAIHGLAAGTATITYTVAGSGGCDNATVTRDITVTAAPVAGTLSGVQNICAGGTSTFSSTINGGSWSSGDLAVATIDPTTGLINGLTSGTATMTYTVTGIGGCGNATVTRTVTVTAAPVAGTLSGNQNICVDAATTFSSTTSGGSWSSGNPGVATINASTGEIHSLAAGTATMTYTVAGSGGCADVTATRVVTVTAAPVAGTLSGIQNVCAGSTTTFSSTITGGSWSSGNTAVATIDPTTGVINGLTAGTSTMTYTVAGAGGCGNATVTRTVTVNAEPIAGTLSGTQNICSGSSTTFSSTISGGNWSSGNTSIATIDPSTGLVTGVTAGTVTMTYTVTGIGGCSDAVATRTITLTVAPDAGTLSGNQNICVGGTSTFISTTTGGTWSSNAASIATVDPSTGVINGLAAGTATISYTVAGAGGCGNATVTRNVIVTAAPSPGVLSGNQNICLGSTSAFSSTVSGGTWSSSDPSVATIDPGSGLVTSVANGSATMTYTVSGTGNCADVSATRNVAVSSVSSAGTLRGTQDVCLGGTTNFYSTIEGGSWTSSDNAIATIDEQTGMITGVSGGTATITYSITGTGGCSTVTNTRSVAVSVSPAPVSGTLSGVQHICTGSNTTFSSTESGGHWDSDNTGVATIDPATGEITGISAGTATMTYTVTGTGVCADAIATRTVTVTAAPIAGILGGNQNVCVGSTTTFNSTIAGGVWTSDQPGVATIDPSTGLINGVGAGTATMTYTVAGNGGCGDAIATRVVTVTAAPVAGTLSGSGNICVGSNTTFSSTVLGGSWSSSNLAVATIDATGQISALSAGTSTITYTVSGTGGCGNATVTKVVTVTAAPVAGTLSGTRNICIGSTSTFSSTETGGVWSSDNTSVATIDPSTGLINGLGSGTATMTYTVTGTGGCSDAVATRTVTVTAAAVAGTLSGVQSVCIGNGSTFSSTISGGSWSSGNTAVATINASTGEITALTAGTATMTYTVPGSGGCGNATDTRVITVTAPVTAGTLGGNQSICVGSTTTFNSTINGGSWSSGNTVVATIDPSTGLINGLGSGTATMTYTVTGTGGCGDAIATRTVTVTAAPIAGTLGGNQNVCVGSTTTFNSTIAGGVWTSDQPGVATIDPSTGLINGFGAGTATMTYTVAGNGGCGDAIATRVVTVTAAPVAGTLSGSGNICVGSTATFSSTVLGGTWSSSNSAVASIDAAGQISALSAGTSTITYTVSGTGGCGNAMVTKVVTVTAAPVAGTLSGTGNICIGSTSTFSSTETGGVWSSDNTSVATIDPSTGLINGLGSGTATMTYTVTGTGGCSDAVATRTITVTAAPVAGTLSGTRNICIGSTSTFSSTETGGVWSSDNTSVATIDPSTGLINGLGSGTATMTYTVTGTGGCSDAIATRTVTVTAAPIAGTLGGNQSICVGSTTTFNSTINGGSWSSGNTAVATIDPSTGLINGLGSGTVTMTYTVIGTGGCGDAIATRTVTVTAAPIAGTLGGNQNVCVGGTTTFNSTIAGGIWTSDQPGVSTIDPSTGLINGVGAGTATMTYTVAGNGGCGDAIATRVVTVTAAPVAGTLSGSGNICVGSNTTFSSTVLGGSWSSSNSAVATIDATGQISALSAGTSTITYTVAGTGGCGNAMVTKVVTVTAAPVAGTLSGTGNICIGSTSAFSSTETGGVWSSDNTSVATIDPSTGLVNGLGSGTATMTYTVTGTGGCSDAVATRTVTVTAAPVAGTLSGVQSVCIGNGSTFSSTISGGSWSSGNTAVATINASTGEITALTAGTATMTYTVAGSGGCGNATDTRVITVTAPVTAGTLGGNQSICVGSTTTFNSTINGGSWSSGNTAVATIDPSTGLINGLGSGTATMTYTVIGTGGCGDAIATRTVTVTAAPIAGTLGGNQNVCVGSTTTFNSTIAGGVWTSDQPGVATIDPSTGLINGVGAGTATMTYTVAGNGGCGDAIATRVVTVTAAPVAGTLSGSGNICVGSNNTFSSTVLGGSWSSSNSAVATIDATGQISALSAGTLTITYTVSGAGGCGNAMVTKVVTVTAAPVAGTLSGTGNICIGSTSTFSSTETGGVWSSDNTSVATIDPSTGLINGLGSGTATMTYTVTGTGGCSDAIATRLVTVTVAPVAGTLSGIQSVCIGNGSTFSSTISGGSWSSGNTAVATINASTGEITALTAGTATMTYTVIGTGGCGNATDTRVITVTAPVTAGTLGGNQSICVGSTTTFNSTINGGSWSSGNTAVATINASTGEITALTAGTATMTYTVIGTGGCGDAIATRTVTVTAAPIAGALGGNQNVCVGSTTTFNSTIAGGVWTSDQLSVATIDPSTGLINGVGAGTATMTYTVAGNGGCGDALATRVVTVTAAPVAGTLSGSGNICVGSNTTFSSTVLGGSWSSSNSAVATIDATGQISALSAGTSTITYTVSGAGGCGNAMVTKVVTVTAAPVAGTLSGTGNICIGSTSTFSSTETGGVWSSDNTSVATIDPSTGLINGLGSGTATMTYTVTGTGGCSDAIATRLVTVTVAPVAGTLSGIQSVCIGNGSTFSSTISGGSWSSGNTAVATINASTGEITALTAGTATMTYTVIGTGGCGDAIATRTVTVTAAPIAGALGGNQNVCVGSTTTFNSTIAGGVWTSDQPGVATIDPSTGLINGVGAGTATITYTVAGNGGCGDALATRVVTVTAAPVAGTLSGSGNICVGSNTTFSSTVLGGSWSSSNSAVATIDATGQISALSAGTSTITYTVSGAGGCGNAMVTKVVTVTAAPVAGTLSGVQSVCIGNGSTFSSTISGGSWSSGNTAVATINASTGEITALTAGTATMTYTVAGKGGCGDAIGIREVFISIAPNAGSLNGPANLCAGTKSTFISTVTGGSWSSSNPGVATIDASTGEVSGLQAGTVTITYTVTGSGGCANATAMSTVTILPGASCAAMSLQKNAVFNDVNGNGTAEAGETITYSFTVRNTGSVTLTGITINDPLVPVTGSIASLAPGVSDGTTFSAVYTIKQSDVDAGKVTNQATATGKTPDNTPVTVSSDDPLTPAPGDGTTTTLSAAGKMVLQKRAVFNDVNGNGTAEAGETITYSFTVRNTGSVTLTGITINDPLVPVTGSIASLAPGVSDGTTFSAVYTIKQSDVDAGKVTNQATATGKTPDNTPVTVSSDDPLTPAPGDGTTTTLSAAGKMVLQKRAVFNDVNGNGTAEAGETITYSFTVRNTGSVTLTGITINDPLVPVTGSIASLAPGVSDGTTFSAVYTIKQSDVDAGKVTNQATATGKTPDNTPVTVSSDDPLTPAPGDGTTTTLSAAGKMVLQKRAVFNDVNGNGTAEAGETITYSFTVRNTGSVTLTGITINDPLVPVTGSIASLAPGVSDGTTFSAVYTIKQSDVDAGKVTNQATATGKTPDNTPVTVRSDDPLTPAPGDGTTTTLSAAGKMVLQKRAVFNDVNGNGTAEAGETITYSFTVRNTGSVTLTGITINDPLVPVTGSIASLAPGVSDGTTFSAVYTIKQSDVDAGQVTNQATATGKTPNNTPVTVSSDDPLTPAPGDGTTTTLSAAGKMVLQKRAVFSDVNGNGTAEAGETITYSFTVRNTGSVTLTGITINDPLVPVTGSIASLAPGVSDGTTFSAVYTIKQSDVDAGKVTNQATATGKTPDNTPVTVSSDDPLTPAPGDGTTTTLSAAGKMVLQKRAVFNDVNGNDTAEAGETITYSFTVRNTGSVTLTGITINDPLVPVTGSIASLAPGVSDGTTFSAVYTIKQSDVDAGKVTNQATATGKTPNNTPVTVSSDDPLTPAPGDGTTTPLSAAGKMVLQKRALFNDVNGNGTAEAGETITYSFTVRNTGSVTLTGITINDPLVPVTGSIASLAPGVSDGTTFNAVYTIKQSDVDAGKVTNQATATGKTPNNTPVTVSSDDPLTPAPGDGTTTTLSTAGKMVLQKNAVFNDMNGNGTAEAGETITYSFTVRNTGSVTLTGITINDQLVPVTGSIASLAPGVSDGTTFSAVYTIKQSDVDAGKVTNQATATGKTPNNTPVTVSSDDPLTPAPGDGTTTTLSAAGKMVLQKNAVFNDVNGNGTAEAGETITYSFTVQNTGSVTLTGITINDPLVPVTGSIASLAPGVSDATTFSAVYTIKQSDVDAGQVTNQATGRGQTPSGTPVISISDDPSTSVPNDPTKTTLPKVDPSQLKISIDLLKTYVLNDENGNGRVDVGETIDYKFTVTNTGQVNLMDVVLTDDFLPGVVVSGGPIKLLVPGQRDVNTFSARYRVTQEDLNKGQILNQASVKARDGIGRIAQDMSDDPGNPTNKDVNGDNNPDDVTAININNCEIKVYDIISANNDGINDELKIEGLNCYLKNRVDIFNRWGIKVFGTENYGKNNNTFSGYSDGRVTIQRGQKLPTGTYYYVIEYIDSTGKTMKKAGPLYVITK